MDDTGLLRDLARAAREEEADESDRWERWDRLTDGALSPEEEAELRELAASSPEAEQAYEAFRPLSPEFRAKMVVTIGPMLGGNAAPVEVVEPMETSVQVKPARPVLEEKSRGRLPFPWWPARFVWRLGFVGSGLTAAAALFLVLRPLERLPAYTLAEVVPGFKTERGEGTALLAGEPFTVDAHAENKFGSGKAVGPYCFVKIAQSVAVHAADCSALKRYENGSMTVQGRLPKDLPAGRATLWIVIAYPGHQPTAEAIEASPGAPDPKHLSVTASRDIEIRAP